MEKITQHNQDEYKILIELKKQITTLIKSGAFEEDYNLTEDEKKNLDDFFEKTNMEVIEKILFKVRERLLYKKNHTKWKKNKFDVSTLAIIFPDCHHGSLALCYLEEKYNDKLMELGLDELGLIDCNINLSQARKQDSFYNISYSNPSKHKKNRYGINSYMLEVTFSMSKKKVLKKHI